MKIKLHNLLPLCLLIICTSCFHTSKLNKLYNNGAQLKASDVVLFTGFNGTHSQTSEIMMDQTRRILKKYGVKAHYLHNTDFNSEFVKSGFLATKVDVANPKFLDNMAEVYGLTYIFNVIPTTNYQGETLPVSTPEKLYNNSGIIFEVYSVQDEEIVASMHLTGDTIGLLGDDGDTNVRDGNVYKNYGKGLRKLMKASRY